MSTMFANSFTCYYKRIFWYRLDFQDKVRIFLFRLGFKFYRKNLMVWYEQFSKLCLLAFKKFTFHHVTRQQSKFFILIWTFSQIVEILFQNSIQSLLFLFVFLNLVVQVSRPLSVWSLISSRPRFIFKKEKFPILVEIKVAWNIWVNWIAAVK